jgi:hypothetical protein
MMFVCLLDGFFGEIELKLVHHLTIAPFQLLASMHVHLLSSTPLQLVQMLIPFSI